VTWHEKMRTISPHEGNSQQDRPPPYLHLLELLGGVALGLPARQAQRLGQQPDHGLPVPRRAGGVAQGLVEQTPVQTPQTSQQPLLWERDTQRQRARESVWERDRDREREMFKISLLDAKLFSLYRTCAVQ